MKKSVTKKLTQKICLALACGLVFAAGGQMSKAEAGGSIVHLYGAETGEVSGVTANKNGVKTSISGDDPNELKNSITVGADFVVYENSWDRVYGGYAYNSPEALSIHDNSVTISTDGTIGSVYGGQVYQGVCSPTIKDNTVTIKKGTINGDIYGGKINNSNGNHQITGNKVFIDGGTTTATFGVFNRIIGGYADITNGDVNIENNEVHISDGTVNNRQIAGGAVNETGGASVATGNKVIISGGTVTGTGMLGGPLNIYGGLAESQTGTATASGNTVEIFGGKVTGNVYGGLAGTESGTVTAKDNTVTLGNKDGAGVADITGNVYTNAVFKNGTTAAQPNGTLNVYNAGNKIDGSLYAPMATINFYVPKDAASNATLLTANTADFLGATIKIDILPTTDITLIKTDASELSLGSAKYYIGDKQIKVTKGTGKTGIITDNKDYLLAAIAKLQVNDTEIKYSAEPQFLAGSYTDTDGYTLYAGGRTSSLVTIDADTAIPAIQGDKKCQIYGVGTSDGSPATGGTIDLKATRDLSGYDLWGGLSTKPDGSFGPVSGNTLNVRSLNIKANSIQNFDTLNFYVPKTAVNGDTMLTVNTATIDGATIHAGVATGSGLKKNDTINLLAAAALTEYRNLDLLHGGSSLCYSGARKPFFR